MIYAVVVFKDTNPPTYVGFRPPMPLPEQLGRTVDGKVWYFDEFGRVQIAADEMAKWLWEEIGGRRWTK